MSSRPPAIPGMAPPTQHWLSAIKCATLMLLVAVWLTPACTPGTTTQGPCQNDLDCKGSQVCVNNTCQLAQSEPSSAKLERPQERRDTKEPTPSELPGSDEINADSTEPVIESDGGGEADPVDGPCIDGYTRPCYSGPKGTLDVGTCVAGTQTCVNGLWDPACQDEVLPSQEICDGEDNDCNGKVDDTFPEQGASCQIPDKKGPCAFGTSVCNEGKLACESSFVKQPTEDCSNKIDDDCDGIPDGPPCKCNAGEVRECYTGPSQTANVGECIKGKTTCASDGKWGQCVGESTPQAEICDGRDNDCDGQVDETYPEKGRSCSDTTKQGICRDGVYTACQNGQLQCTSNTQATQEICGNGKDDDCDGQSDENPPCDCKPGQTRSCYNGPTGTDKRAPCKRGTQTCNSSGKWDPCQGEIVPKAETCDKIDNDCNGFVDDRLTRLCSTQCAKGTESCKDGQWGGCTARKPTAEICDNKDNDCDGQIDESLTQSCSNICGKGTETCRAGQWVSCSAPAAGKEVCDKKDNDCDGQIDEGNPGGGASCSIKTLQGECAKGQMQCVSGVVSCRQVNFKKTEVCNKLDDDCDGSIDESDPRSGTSCTLTTLKGACRAGSYSCVLGRLICRQRTFPTTEKCRDQIDNDCDGKTDEICGTAYTYAKVSSSGAASFQRNFSSIKRVTTGTYRLTPTSTDYGCSKRPIFVSTTTSTMRPVSYTCNGDSFDVRLATTAPRSLPAKLLDQSFNAVIPYKTGGAAFGVVSCSSTKCSVSRSWGGATVKRIQTGVYDISFSGCNSGTQPVFAMNYSSYTSAYYVGYYLKSGVCRVRSFALSGTGELNTTFAFWIPNRDSSAYAIVNSTGTLYTSNNFNDTRAKWSSTRVTTSSGNQWYYKVSFPALNSNTAVFAIPRTSLRYYSAPTTSSSQANIYTREIQSPNGYKASSFSVLFVQ